MGELTALPQTPSWIQGVLLLKEEKKEKKEKKGKKEKERKMEWGREKGRNKADILPPPLAEA